VDEVREHRPCYRGVEGRTVQHYIPPEFSCGFVHHGTDVEHRVGPRLCLGDRAGGLLCGLLPRRAVCLDRVVEPADGRHAEQARSYRLASAVERDIV
jgi:hypothetical protein